MRTAAVIVILTICLCLSATGAQIIKPSVGPAGAGHLQPVSVQALTNFNRNTLLSNINKQVTLEGYYYDGSIPMILDRFDRVASDEIIPDEAYVALTGAQVSGVKWGDRIKVQGTVERPSATDPKLGREAAVVRITQAQQVQVLRPGGLMVRTPYIDLSKIKVRPVQLAKRYAVLIAGGISPAQNHVRYWNDLKTMYSILKAQGYDAANIYVIYADGVGRDGSMPVNYPATKPNIATVFTSLGARMTANDTLYIMMNDHGGSGNNDTSGDETVTHRDEVLCLWGGINMTDDEFAVELNKITNYQRIVIQMKQCYSGGYVDDLTKPNRIIMASASPTQVSWAHPPDYLYGEFTHWYFAAFTGSRPDGGGAVPSADTNGDGMVSFVEAYNFAREHDVQPETPQYEDNGVKPCATGAMPAAGEGALGAGCTM